MFDADVPYRIADPEVYQRYRDFSLDWLEWSFGVDLPTPKKDPDMSSNKFHTRWSGSNKQRAQMGRGIVNYCKRWGLSSSRFAELSGISKELADDIVYGQNNRRIMVADYNNIQKQLDRPLFLAPRTASEILHEEFASVPNEVSTPRVTVVMEEVATHMPLQDPLDAQRTSIRMQLPGFLTKWQLKSTQVSEWANLSSTYVAQFLNGSLKGSPVFLDRMLEMLTCPDGLPDGLKHRSLRWVGEAKHFGSTGAVGDPEPIPGSVVVVPIGTRVAVPDGTKTKWVFRTHQPMEVTYVLEADNYTKAAELWAKGVRGERVQTQSLGQPDVVEVKKYGP